VPARNAWSALIARADMLAAQIVHASLFAARNRCRPGRNRRGNGRPAVLAPRRELPPSPTIN